VATSYTKLKRKGIHGFPQKNLIAEIIIRKNINSTLLLSILYYAHQQSGQKQKTEDREHHIKITGMDKTACEKI